MPIPPDVPEGMTRNVFGTEVMKWGGSDAQARQRIQTLTREELVEKKVTLQMVREWRDFYRDEVVRVPRNPSARGRAELMARAVELLEAENG